MSLPPLRVATKRELARFERKIARPVAMRVLRRRLGVWKMLRFALRYLAASLRDPFKGTSREGWPPDREALVRQQLRSALLLDHATRGLLPEPDRLALLREVIGETGSRFIDYMVTLPTFAQWSAATAEQRQAFAEQIADGFFNAQASGVNAGDESISYDVCACRFAQLTKELGREHLAPMFCAADSVFFERTEAPVALRRTTTIADGGPHCDFRFQYRKPGSEGPSEV